MALGTPLYSRAPQSKQRLWEDDLHLIPCLLQDDDYIALVYKSVGMNIVIHTIHLSELGISSNAILWNLTNSS